MRILVLEAARPISALASISARITASLASPFSPLSVMTAAFEAGCFLGDNTIGIDGEGDADRPTFSVQIL